MTPERWQQVQDVLERALELAPGERSAYLDQTCSSDPSLRHEVETLRAASSDVRTSFLQPSSADRITLVSGTKIGEYEVKSLLGSGGMGEVYRARDSRLGRDVAIKVLPPFLSTDPERLRRFEQEARAAAALNHPNILAVFQMGNYESAPYMVSELLEGATLREQINRGRLSFRKTIDYGVQIAHGLAAAHEKGIIHRDLKPENLFVTKDERVKILDFGLAKLTQRRPGSENSAPTLTDETEAGTVMGTVGYMSPEQVRGQTADHRTDLFSFGAILYEMLVGKRAFQKATAADTQSAILNEDPPEVSKSVPDVSPAMQRVVHRCLEKNPEQRFQSASDLAFALDALSDARSPLPSLKGATAVGGEGRHSTTTHRLLYGGLAIALLIFGFALRWYLSQQATAPRTVIESQLTRAPSENRLLHCSISPDGKHLAYTDAKGLHLRLTETGETHDISIAEELRSHLWDVAWLADGENLLFTTADESGYTMWLISIYGGSPRKLRKESTLLAMAPSPKDSSIAFLSGLGHEIWVMNADGGSPKQILKSEVDRFAALAWSPTGRRIAYLKVPSEEDPPSIETVSLDGAPPSLVISEARLFYLDQPPLVWLPDGRLLFGYNEAVDPLVQGDDLWGIKADPQTGKPYENLTRILNSHGLNMGDLSISRDGRRLALKKMHIRLDVYVGELKEKGTRLDTIRRLSESDSQDWASGWSLDGKTVLFSSDRTGKQLIFQQRVGEETAEPLIVESPQGNADLGAEMSPDGRWILYWSTPPGGTVARVMRIPSSGGPPEEVTETLISDRVDFHCPYHMPGSSCVFSQFQQDQLFFYSLNPVGGRGKQLAHTKMGKTSTLQWSISPDGLRFAIISWDQLPGQVRVLDWREGKERNIQVPSGWKLWALSWDTNGTALYVAVSSKLTGYFLARVDMNGKFTVLLARGMNHWLSVPVASPDGNYLAFGEQTWESNAWMLENF